MILKALPLEKALPILYKSLLYSVEQINGHGKKKNS